MQGVAPQMFGQVEPEVASRRDRRRALLGWRVRRKTRDISSDLRMRGSRHRHGASDANRTVRHSYRFARDYKSHAGDQL